MTFDGRDFLVPQRNLPVASAGRYLWNGIGWTAQGPSAAVTHAPSEGLP